MRSIDSSEEAVDAGIRLAVRDARAGRSDMLAEIMRRHNQRLFRVARSILKDEAEAEDVVQDAFLTAFTRLDSLKETTSADAWLTRITVNLALSRLRRIKRHEPVPLPDQESGQHGAQTDGGSIIPALGGIEIDAMTPERLAAMSEIRTLLEQEIDKLPDGFREVFVCRAVEQMTIGETAAALDIKPETVKTRLHRARGLLRTGLEDVITALSLRAFPFGGKRCARTTETVLARLRDKSSELSNTDIPLHH